MNCLKVFFCSTQCIIDIKKRKWQLFQFVNAVFHDSFKTIKNILSSIFLNLSLYRGATNQYQNKPKL